MGLDRNCADLRTNRLAEVRDDVGVDLVRLRETPRRLSELPDLSRVRDDHW
jgi:hypothetical protein